MKVIHLNSSDSAGGAARAAYRIHNALRDLGVISVMWVNAKHTGDWRVESSNTRWSKAIKWLRSQFGVMLGKAFRSDNPILHSFAVLPSNWVKLVNASDADVVHLHWVQGEMLSIADISRIKKPIVWTLHDMWAFCGAEHVAWDERWREGYLRDNRPAHESGFDLNRWVWMRKMKHWNRPMQIITPSHWLANCVSESALMHDWPVSVIPNCLDIERWKPIEQTLARELLGLPLGVPLILFGTDGANAAHHKGFDLLLDSVVKLQGKVNSLELVVFGQLAPRNPPNLGFPIHYTGYLHDDLTLRALYSAVDALVVPSRQEAFGQTASEAQACGTPVVAFNIGGLRDIIKHKRTGYLARPFETEDLAAGILWVLSHGSLHSSDIRDKDPTASDVRKQARERAVARFSNELVAEQYRTVYNQLTF